MDCLVVSTRRFILIPRTLHEGPQVFQRDPSVDLRQGALDDVLHVGGAEGAASIECEKVSPRLGRKSPALVRTKNAEVHEKERLGVKARET